MDQLVSSRELRRFKQSSVDLIAAALASALVTPWITAVDKVILARSMTGASFMSSIRQWALRPRATLASLFIPFPIYFGTYAIANLFDSFNTTRQELDPIHDLNAAVTRAQSVKFAATAAVNTGLCIFKDAYFAKMSTGTRVPMLSCSLFLLRDGVTIYSSYNLPHIVAPKLAEFPFAHILHPDDLKMNLAHVVMPTASQMVSTPIHLLALDVHARQFEVPIRERLRLMAQYAKSAIPLRMMRILPSFGIGSVANHRFRKKMLEGIDASTP